MDAAVLGAASALGHQSGTEFANIEPADHDTYIGAPGTILDGQHK